MAPAVRWAAGLGAAGLGDRVSGGSWALPAELGLLYTWPGPARATRARYPAKAEPAPRALGCRAELAEAGVPGRKGEPGAGRRDLGTWEKGALGWEVRGVSWVWVGVGGVPV